MSILVKKVNVSKCSVHTRVLCHNDRQLPKILNVVASWVTDSPVWLDKDYTEDNFNDTDAFRFLREVIFI